MQTSTQQHRLSLPKWEDLSAPIGTETPAFSAALQQLREHRPDGPYRFARFVISTFLRDPSYQKMLDFQWPDIIDVMADQVRRNHGLAAQFQGKTSSSPISLRADRTLSRPFSQMPCTPATTHKRVEKISRLVAYDAPILLLGDDDMVSIDLAQAGFKDITAVDICPRVLQQIRRTSNDHAFKIRMVQHDLSRPAPAILKRPYALVSFDPPYSLAGVKLFMDAAMDFTAQRPGTHLLLCVHLMSLSRRGLPALEQFFAATGVEIREFEQGFNSYPAPKRLKGLIHLANRIVINSKILSTEGYSFPYLLSDMLLLRKT